MNENKDFPSEGAVYNNLLNTLGLLYEWLINKKHWAYFELREKYKIILSPEQVGKSLKIISERLRNYNAETDSVGYGTNSNNIVIDDFIDILNEQNTDWNGVLQEYSISQTKSNDIATLKKRIKYCKNPMEKKKLEQKLNLLYKSKKEKR